MFLFILNVDNKHNGIYTINIIYIPIKGIDMKSIRTVLILLIGTMIMTACAGGLGNDTAEEMGDGFEFSEEEAIDLVSEKGFEFSDDEGLLIELDEEDGAEDEGFDFDDDEALDLSDQPDQILPPAGISNWMVMHADGTAVCPSMTIPIWGREPETISITVGAEAQSLIVAGMDGGPEIFYLLEQAGPGGSIYNGYYQPPGASSEIHYQILFTTFTDPMVADFLMGSITSEAEGCKISRLFDGNRID
jgi:hypothetical protein